MLFCHQVNKGSRVETHHSMHLVGDRVFIALSENKFHETQFLAKTHRFHKISWGMSSRIIESSGYVILSLTNTEFIGGRFASSES